MSRRILLGIGYYAVATLLAFISPLISVILFAGLPLPYFMRSSEIDRHIQQEQGGMGPSLREL